jgi:hypothetical protein
MVRRSLMDEEILRRLEAAFPSTTDADVYRGTSEGVLLADDLLENTPLLRTLAGRDLRGHVRRAGIIFRLRDLCVRGDLPFQADIVPMPHGNWHWLELRSGNFKAHPCRTEGTFEFPEETRSRQDERLRNQGDLFAQNIVPIGELVAQIRVLYAWLTFGIGRDGQLSHLCWAMPPADDGFWLAHVNVLERIAKKNMEPKEPEAPSATVKLRFKESIEEALSKQDDENETKH